MAALTDCIHRNLHILLLIRTGAPLFLVIETFNKEHRIKEKYDSLLPDTSSVPRDRKVFDFLHKVNMSEVTSLR